MADAAVNWDFIDNLIRENAQAPPKQTFKRREQIQLLKKEVLKRNDYLLHMLAFINAMSSLNSLLAEHLSADHPELFNMVKDMRLLVSEMGQTVYEYSNIDFQALGSSENRPA